jgi:hypothetical protein
MKKRILETILIKETKISLTKSIQQRLSRKAKVKLNLKRSLERKKKSFKSLRTS